MAIQTLNDWDSLPVFRDKLNDNFTELYTDKLDKNTAITWATKTKITYDADWLVTWWTDATTADIADSTNRRYVTDAQLIVVGNTSNTNTGDETTTTIWNLINWATADTAPVDADMFGLMDSTSSNILRKFSWANMKSNLKSYFDTLYASISWSVAQTFWALTIELWHATDTTLSRLSAWVLWVEWVAVPTVSSTSTLTNKTLTKPTVNGSTNAITAATDWATITFDLSASDIHTVTLWGNRTLALSNVSVWQIFALRLQQDATWSRTVTWFSTIKWAWWSAPTLTTTANKADTFVFMCTGSNAYDWSIYWQNF